jgi:hypothetical protein
MSSIEDRLYHKFNVTRADGRDQEGEKHHECKYFVLDVTHDPHALVAVTAYADNIAAMNPIFASILYDWIRRMEEHQAGAANPGHVPRGSNLDWD